MRSLRVLIVALAALAAASVGLAAVHTSGASFTSSSTTVISASADSIHNWLHLWTASTDPDPSSPYFTAEGSSTPAASGRDETATVHLGSWVASSTPTTAAAVFALQALPELPADMATVSVTVTATPDADTHFQPIAQVGIAPWGDPSLAADGVILAPGDKEQVNAVLDLAGAQAGAVYHPTLVVTLTYEGMRTVYYQYKVPVTVAVDQ